jgi:hypothetical protein
VIPIRGPDYEERSFCLSPFAQIRFHSRDKFSEERLMLILRNPQCDTNRPQRHRKWIDSLNDLICVFKSSFGKKKSSPHSTTELVRINQITDRFARREIWNGDRQRSGIPDVLAGHRFLASSAFVGTNSSPFVLSCACQCESSQ